MSLNCNNIGNVGENIAAMRFSKYGIFNVYFMGEKAPIEDFLLEIDDDKNPYCCFVQVKSTADKNKYTKKKRIKTPVPKQNLEALIDRPLPTYVAGVDIDKEIVYVAPAFDKSVKYSSIPTTLILDVKNKGLYKQNLIKLRDDIINYWSTIKIANHKNSYKSIL